jgi:WhiB family redox-sensing transcriptional regulator
VSHGLGQRRFDATPDRRIEQLLAEEYARCYGDGDHKDPEPWKRSGLCRETDPEAFFPEKGCSTRPGKKICNGGAHFGDGCPVKAECLAYALRHGERFGIWGGLSEPERRRYRRKGERLTVAAGERMYADLERQALELSGKEWPDGQVAAIVEVSEHFVTRAKARALARAREAEKKADGEAAAPAVA